MDESRRVSGLSAANCLAWLACLASESRSESCRIHHPFYRRLDSPVPAHHAGGDTAARVAAPAATDPVSPDDRAVRLLLWMSPFADLCLVRQILRRSRDAHRYCEAALHNGRFRWIDCH